MSKINKINSQKQGEAKQEDQIEVTRSELITGLNKELQVEYF